MRLATLFVASCCVIALPHVTGAQTIFNFDSGVNGEISYNGTTLLGNTPAPASHPGQFLGNTISGFVNDTDGTLLVADNDPTTTLTLQTTGNPATGFTPNGAFRFLAPTAIDYANYFGPGLSGNILANEDTSSSDVLSLTFNKTVTSITLNFTIVPNEFDLSTGDPITGAGGSNATSSLQFVGGNSAGGTLDPTSGNFFGTLSETGSFSSLSLAYNLLGGTDFGFAIDNITVTPATPSVPEPGSVALAAASLLTVAGLLRRRKK
jgi:hypothetical protein